MSLALLPQGKAGRVEADRLGAGVLHAHRQVPPALELDGRLDRARPLALDGAAGVDGVLQGVRQQHAYVQIVEGHVGRDGRPHRRRAPLLARLRDAGGQHGVHRGVLAEALRLRFAQTRAEALEVACELLAGILAGKLFEHHEVVAHVVAIGAAGLQLAQQAGILAPLDLQLGGSLLLRPTRLLGARGCEDRARHDGVHGQRDEEDERRHQQVDRAVAEVGQQQEHRGRAQAERQPAGVAARDVRAERPAQPAPRHEREHERHGEHAPRLREAAAQGSASQYARDQQLL
nr:hypothetical protein [Arabiibacter massiliensis]